MTALTIVTIVASFAALAAGALAWRWKRQDRDRSAARVAALAATLDGAHDAGAADAPVMFSPTHAAFPHDQPLLKAAAGFVAVVAVILIAALVTDGRERAAEPKDAEGASLALLSMRHERSGDTLTVTGLVRNRGPEPAEGIVATVLVFDNAGTFLASGRAPLDVRTLTTGEDSPFRIAVPQAAGVTRYRVSFRNDRGVIRHLDRRARWADGATVAAARSAGGTLSEAARAR